MAETNQTQREEELARREALLAQREAQLEKEQAELAAAKAQSAERKKTLLDNNDPNFVNPKEKLYDKFPLTVHQMDIIIGVLFALILLFLVLGMTHTSFFGLFGGLQKFCFLYCRFFVLRRGISLLRERQGGMKTDERLRSPP